MVKVVIIVDDDDLGNPEVSEALKALLEAIGGDAEAYYEEEAYEGEEEEECEGVGKDEKEA